MGVDCATFDRVLLFLEACARGTPDAFSCDIQALEPLGQAARALGCRPLREWCQRLGDFQSRIRMHHWADIVKHNESGGCIVTMDGMVFDLEAWLPEHPGGSTITATGAQQGLHRLLRAVPRVARVLHLPARVLHRRDLEGGARARPPRGGARVRRLHAAAA